MNSLKGKKILLIITGGIASYKSLDLIRRLQENGSNVECILTKNAENFVKVLSFESLLGKKIHSNLFSLDQESNMNHIKLASDSDIIVVAPCTANFLSKMSSGIADDLATNVLLASNKIKVIAPAMNTIMWRNKIVKKNIANLKKLGTHIFSPYNGKLACRTKGVGKLMEINQIVENLNLILSPKILSGLKAVVTAGPSVEKIDPIRFLSNFSSGQQGYEIADSLIKFGAETTLISGPSIIEPPKGAKFIQVKSGKDFFESAKKNLPCDIFISVAAISDWYVKKVSKNKIKKKSNGKFSSIDFSLNKDVLKYISSHKLKPQLVIGFSAETENLLKNTKKKMEEKGCDWMLGNEITEDNPFSSHKNKIFFFEDKKVSEWPKMKKNMVALKLTKKIVSFFKKNRLVKYDKDIL